MSTPALSIEALRIEPVVWRLREPLRSARGALTERSGLQVVLDDASGARGSGEALPLAAWGTESPGQMRVALEAAAPRLLGASGDLDALLDRVDRACTDAPAARCALDVALHDLAARRAGCSVAALLADAPRTRVPLNAVLGADDAAGTIDAALAACAAGFRTLKLKCGADPPAVDLARVRALREALGPEPRLRLDANGAWDERAAIALLERLAALDIELVEQPVAAGELDALARVAARSPVTVAADEALALPAGRDALARGELTRVAVLKPLLLGGLRAAARLARDARAAGVRCLVTTTFDGPLGTAAALQLAAAIADPELACGLATLDALDVAVPDVLRPRDGWLDLPGGPGLGLEAP